MRVGLAAIYSWRPHVEHLQYVASLLREAGHETSFLACDSDLSACYTQELRPGRSRFMHCARCRLGGVRSYPNERVMAIGALAADPEMLSEEAKHWSRSSASTLGRYEADADFESQEFFERVMRLAPATQKTYSAARAWIDRERLDSICLFNGRMDVTRAVLEAAKDARIPFVSLERTWFGDGLQLLPGENCLGLRSIQRMTADWRDVPLTRDQALRAAGLVASRFLRSNTNEWRAYNASAKNVEWPNPDARRKVLLVPGSRNEKVGHPDWESGWPDRSAALDAVIDHFGLKKSDVVLRCHPNWGEKIGTQDGRHPERYYTDWARDRGIHVIGSTDSTSTLGLIEQADAVVVCGGSASLEAGMLGKQVIATTPSIYHRAGFQTDADSPRALQEARLHADLPEAEGREVAALIAQRTLRYAYSVVFRVPQYVDYVRCITTTRYEYGQGADPERIVKLLQGMALQPDDATAATEASGEQDVLEAVRRRAWRELREAAPKPQSTPLYPVKRRFLYRPIDRIRDVFPRGDL